jgi:hypothetical protein
MSADIVALKALTRVTVQLKTIIVCPKNVPDEVHFGVDDDSLELHSHSCQGFWSR